MSIRGRPLCAANCHPGLDEEPRSEESRVRDRERVSDQREEDDYAVQEQIEPACPRARVAGVDDGHSLEHGGPLAAHRVAEVIDAPHSRAAAARAVELVSQGRLNGADAGFEPGTC